MQLLDTATHMLWGMQQMAPAMPAGRLRLSFEKAVKEVPACNLVLAGCSTLFDSILLSALGSPSMVLQSPQVGRKPAEHACTGGLPHTVTCSIAGAHTGGQESPTSTGEAGSSGSRSADQ